MNPCSIHERPTPGCSGCGFESQPHEAIDPIGPTSPAIFHGSAERLAKSLQDSTLRELKWVEAAARINLDIHADVSTPEAFEASQSTGITRLMSRIEEKDNTITFLNDQLSKVKAQLDAKDEELARAVVPLRCHYPDEHIEALREEAVFARSRVAEHREKQLHGGVVSHDERFYAGLVYVLNILSRSIVGYFSYDGPMGDFYFHKTPHQAFLKAEKHLDDARDSAADEPGWNDNTQEICWGAIYGQADLILDEERPVNPTEEDIAKFGDNDSLQDYAMPDFDRNALLKDTYQLRVLQFILTCFGSEIAEDAMERNHRFLEEALELVQSCGCTTHEAHQLVEYVFGRPVGEKEQECGGVMVTLAGLCNAQGIEMNYCGEVELARVWKKMDQIREKQARKPKHSPLPA